MCPIFPAEPCRILAFDFLNLLVRAFHAGTKTDTHAVKSLFRTVANAIERLRPAAVVFAMDGGHTRRTELLPEYKAHRPPAEPLLVTQRQLAERALELAGFQTIRVDQWEADDVLASIATKHPGTVIASSDKDLLSLSGPARIFLPWGAGEFATPEARFDLPAAAVSDFLALCGDKSDGIPGVNGIGEKTAAELLRTWENLETILAMAHLQRIPGAIGKRLREQKNTAVRCRNVVELNRLLPLPPVRGWRRTEHLDQRLEELQLRGIAPIVHGLAAAGLLPEEFDPGPNIPEPAGFIPDPAVLMQKPAANIPPAGLVPTAPEQTRPPDSGDVTETDHSHIRQRRVVLTVPELERIDRPPGFGDPRSAAVSSWLAGFRASKYPDTPNPWRTGSFYFEAWNQGRQRQTLNVTLEPDPPAPEPSSATRPQKHRSREASKTLFD